MKKGVFYGTEDTLNQSYKRINEDYPVYVGIEFWHRLTGDSDFYFDLINAFAEVADEIDSTELIQQTLKKLTDELR